jgi:DNA polymerase V
MDTYAAIDLKSYYASCECADRKLDALTTNLVVADISRTEKTICLAVSPSLKALGVPGRPRLFEVIQKVKEINSKRLQEYRRKTGNYRAQFKGSSSNAKELENDPSLELTYIVAPPRMSRYMEVSSHIYSIYMKYISTEDIVVYSIDEVFMDLTKYLKTYNMTARELTMTMIRSVLEETGITATAGIGSNLYLAKVAMDIVAKHSEADENGVRIAEIDEKSYRHILWDHKPLTDFWRVGPGIARRLEANGMYTMGDIARMSVTKSPVKIYIAKPKKNETHLQIMENGEELLYKLFGINAELLIDHAWGWEPTTVEAIKQYHPENSSISSGQVLHEPYSFEKTKIIIREMADELSLELLRKRIVSDKIDLYIGYDRESLVEKNGRYTYQNGKLYTGQVSMDYYGRPHPKHTNGAEKLPFHTSSTKMIIDAAIKIFEEKADPELLVRRLYITALNVIPEDKADTKQQFGQLELFKDLSKEEEERVQKAELDKERRLKEAMLDIKDKYGKNAVLRGTNYLEGARGRDRNKEVGGHKA